MNRVKHITYHDGSYTDYTYDAVGRVDYINDSISGYIDYTYNDFGCSNCSGRGMDRIAQEVTPLGTIDYTYDKVGRRISMTVAGQPTVNYTYDDAGRLTKISRDINGIIKDFNLSYDKGGRRTQLQSPLYKVGTGKKAYWAYLTTTYDPYDVANRILNIKHQNPTSIIEDLLYEYDANGNRTKFTRNAPQTLRSDSTSSTCGITTYTFDVRNRLVSINGFNPDCSTLTASFKYDALGRRIEKTINGRTIQYLYDGLDIVQEIENGQVTVNYIRTLNIDEPLTRIKADGTVRHYVTDALGSVIALTDDTGVVKTTYTYDPFGNVTVSGEASDNPFQYTGRENGGTGLYYYRARYYSPELQRFISEDPIGLAGGINFYTYVGNNPIYYADPFGLFPQIYGQGGGQFSGHVGISGLSVSGGLSASTGGEVCGYVTVCLRLGPGIYAGAGGTVGGGVAGGNTSGLKGLSIGLGADFGWGPAIGGQVSAGVSSRGINSGGISKGFAGGGGGFSLGLDICWTEMKCRCSK